MITAASRTDLAYATGYAHAQDRFFQMDLSRRLAAGELSELFGAVALKQDRRTRRFGFRAVAQRVIEATPATERAIIEAYSRGVNAGLASLAARPWEYLLLRATPAPWLPEDSVLVVHSMWWQLQYGTLREEIGRRRLERAATESSDPAAAHELITFIYAGHSDWDTPNYSAESPCVQSACTDSARVLTHSFPAQLRFAGAADKPAEEAVAPGSNNWAVAGVHTRSGVALIANDMHLDLGVPAVWYPARLRVTGNPCHRRHRRHASRNAGSRRGFQRPGGLGIHQQLWRFRRRALGQVRERRVWRASRDHRGKGRDVRRSRLSGCRRRRGARR